MHRLLPFSLTKDNIPSIPTILIKPRFFQGVPNEREMSNERINAHSFTFLLHSFPSPLRDCRFSFLPFDQNFLIARKPKLCVRYSLIGIFATILVSCFFHLLLSVSFAGKKCRVFKTCLEERSLREIDTLGFYPCPRVDSSNPSSLCPSLCLSTPLSLSLVVSSVTNESIP